MATEQLRDATYPLAPVFRLQHTGDSGLTAVTYTPSVQAVNQATPDRFIGTSSGSNVVFTYTIVASRNAFLHQLSVQNTGTSGDATKNIINWDFMPYVTQFPGSPNYDALATTATPWQVSGTGTDQGWYTDGGGVGGNVNPGGPVLTFYDGATWQIWYSDDAHPIGFHFNQRVANPGPHWQMFVSPVNHGPGADYCDYPIASGTTFTTSWRTLFLPGATSKPDATVSVPQAFTALGNRWPYQVNTTTYPKRIAWNATFFANYASDGLNWTTNPRRWLGPTTTVNGVSTPQNAQHIWNPSAGHLYAIDGDYSGLNWLKARFVQILTLATDVCMSKVADPTNSIATNLTGYTPGASAFGGTGILAWDLLTGQQYPQQDPSYLGDPLLSLVANINTTLSPLVFAPELTYTDENFTTPVIQAAVAAMGTGQTGIAYPNVFKGVTFRADHVVSSTTLGSGGVHQSYYASLGDTTLGNVAPTRTNNPVLWPSAIVASSNATFAMTNYQAGFLATNQPNP